MKVKRVTGGRVEVLEGVGPTILGEEFEVDEDLGSSLVAQAGRFEAVREVRRKKFSEVE